MIVSIGVSIFLQFLTVFRLLLWFLPVAILRIKYIQMRINTSKSDDEIVMGSHGRRIKSADEILKERIEEQFITPAINGCVAKVLHRDERTNEKGWINGKSS